jgi:uncharacterized repeat protein (TIGR01451 family)
MISERVNKSFEKSGSARLAFVRTVCLFLPVVFLLSLLLFSGSASAASCGTPGKDGVGTPTNVVNTYYPGTALASAGQKSITVGASSGSATTISAGDLLLIIQMQDADIQYTNDNNYGSNSGTGSGYTNLNSTGLYEFAVAANSVGSSGGTLNVDDNLINNYRVRSASETNGQSAFQVIRVPQYSSATVAGTVSALYWNGSVGGVAAIDVAGTLTISSSGSINVNGAGFRGGYGRILTGGTGAYTDYWTLYTDATNGSKGEGIAGSPFYMNGTTYDAASGPVQAAAGNGYPGGTTYYADYARGAPANAGGGGTDGDPKSNDDNSGGGGGSNYGAGGMGGNSWNTDYICGGLGGSAVGVSYSRVVMGGGGGAGTTNNGTADNTTYTNPLGLACTAGAGACSSGAPGGGMVFLRANNITGAGSITANGGDAYNTQNDSPGGGGAGGAVVIYSYTGGSVTVYANGGNGGNAWRAESGTTFPGNRHGPGGGGGGGYIAYNPGTGSWGGTSYVTWGICGKTTTSADNYNAANGSVGYATSYSSNPPGALPGAQCVPNLSTSTKTVVDLTGSYQAGDTLQYTITIQESAGHPATVSVSDAIDTTNLTNVAITSCPAGATCSYSAPTLSASSISVPASGSVSIVYTAVISGSATPGTTISNTATITPTIGTGGTPSAPVVTVAGTTTGTGTKLLYLYDGTSTPTAWKLSRTPNTTSANYATINTTTSQTWTMNPAAAAAITISSAISTTVPVTLYLRRNTTSGNRNVQVSLQCSSGGTILTQTQTLNLTAAITAYAFALPLAGTLTCGQGNYWNLTVSQTSGTDSTRVYPQSGGNTSHVNLPATTVINVNSIGFYSASYALGGGSALSSVAPGSTVYIRAVVSDPFGSYDISPTTGGTAPTITIKNPSGATFVSTGMGNSVHTGGETPSLTEIFEYSFNVPSSPTGNWSVSVTATEGTEGTVTNTAYATMPVVIPLAVLSIVKSANPTSVAPGAVITYTILVTNTGAGSATNATVTDIVPTYTTYVANSTRLNSITVAGDGVTFPLIAGLLIDNNTSRTPGVAASGTLPAGTSATITYQMKVN